MSELNNLLPESEKISINHEDTQNEKMIADCLAEFENASFIDLNLVSQLFRLIEVRRNLKYGMTSELLSRIMKTLYLLYFNHDASPAFKADILKHMQEICKKKRGLNSFNFNWRILWSEAISIATRGNKDNVMPSVPIIGALLSKIVEFLHTARKFIGNEESEAIVKDAMEKLIDIKKISCVEGVLLLVTCLPTSFHLYDEYLPKWISIWQSINNNPYWDLCWLTIFTRSRKYSCFNWSNLSSYFYLKAYESMQFPTGLKTNMHTPFYPHTFPDFYIRILTNQIEPRREILHKLGKLIYFNLISTHSFVSLQSSQSVPLVFAEPITLTPPSLSSNISYYGFNQGVEITQPLANLANFYQTIRHYLYPSNSGQWSNHIADFTVTLINELSRHAGAEYIKQQLNNLNMSNNIIDHSQTTLHDSTIHQNSIQYLIGMLLLILIEGIYSKNNLLSYFSINAMKNLVCLDPELGHIIVPFLLSSLDSKAVNQSHQAPLAMNCLNIIFKSLLYPKPVILQYLPQLLILALPGLDACDMPKSVATMTLYSTIFSWLPIRSNYDDMIASTSLTPRIPYLTDIKNNSNSTQSSLSKDEIYSNLIQCYQEFLPSFMDKIIILLLAQEENKKHDNKNSSTSSRNHSQQNQSSMIGAHIMECVDYLLQAIQCPQLRSIIENKFITFCLTQIPMNAIKISCRIIQALIYTSPDPDAFPILLSKLLTNEILTTGSVSNEKLMFRVRLIASGFLSCQTASFVRCYEQVKPLTTPEFINHTDKGIRKAVHKLIKNMFKGSCSYYPLGANPTMFHLTGSPFYLGQSNTTNQLTWHEPLPVPLLPLLRTLVTNSVVDIYAALNLSPPTYLIYDITASSSTTAPSLPTTTGNTNKKIEEILVINLKLLSKLLRGCAEILGDASPQDTSIASTNTTMISTSRSTVISSLSAADQDILLNLRYNILQMLFHLFTIINNKIYQLDNNLNIYNSWMKLLTITITRRMASLKGVDAALRYHNSLKRMTYNAFHYRVIRILKESKESLLETDIKQNEFYQLQINHWKYLNLNTNMIVNRSWIHFAKRQRIYSFVMTQHHAALALAPAADHENIFIGLLQQITSLCGHSYEALRRRARSSLQDLKPYFGSAIIVPQVILPALADLSGVRGTDFRPVQLPRSVLGLNPSYESVSGAMNLLSLPSVMKRLTTRADHSLSVLYFISYCSSYMISSIQHDHEQDKTEKLLQQLADFVIQYTNHFNTFHLTNEVQLFHFEQLLNSSLRYLGIDIPITAIESQSQSLIDTQNGSMSASTTLSTSSGSSTGGLRQSAYAALIVLHLIGHPNIPPKAGCWIWAVECLSNNQFKGQPIQSFAAAALTKLAYRTSRQLYKNVITVDKTWVSFIYNRFAKSPSAWTSLIQGFSEVKPKLADDGSQAQWSKGIVELIHVTEYITELLPRQTNALYTSHRFSEHFRHIWATTFENFFICLCESCIFLDKPMNEVFNAAYVRGVLEASKGLVQYSAEEDRSNNSTRAELFSGLNRAILVLATKYGIDQIGSDFIAIEKVLTDFLSEHVDKVSCEYSKDWAEGVYYVTTITSSSDLTTELQESVQSLLQDSNLVQYVVNGLQDYLTNCIKTPNSSSSEDTGIGFSQQDKRITLARSSLYGEINALRSFPISTAGKFLSLLLSSNVDHIVSPYRSTRIEIASLLSMLIDFDGSSFSSNDEHQSRIEQLYENILKPILITISSSSSIVVESNLAITTQNETHKLDQTTNSIATSSSSSTVIINKHYYDFCSIWLRTILIYHFSPMRSNSIKTINTLFTIALQGSGHTDLDTAKYCHETCIIFSGTLKAGSETHSLNDLNANTMKYDNSRELLRNNMIDTCINYSTSTSFHIRETIMICITLIQVNNWSCLSNNEKKKMKDLLSKSLYDTKPEVTLLAKIGMIFYFTTKPYQELNVLVEAFIKNSDILAARENQKRKKSGVTVSSKPDQIYVATVMMMSCLVSAFPYDMPSFLPALLSSFVKHINISHLQTVVKDTIQMFQKTHQDRWNDFKKEFSYEQLSDLQGAGAAHYFS